MGLQSIFASGILALLQNRQEEHHFQDATTDRLQVIRTELAILSDYVHRKSLTPDWHVFRTVGTYLVSAVDNLIDPAKRENALVFMRQGS